MTMDGDEMTGYSTAAVDLVADKLASARRDLAVATDLAKEQAALMRDCGESEYTIAEMLGVTRMTVRSWLGK